ncbi:MAG: hypothetical protein AB1552_14100 [Nitrospirota bacterium]
MPQKLYPLGGRRQEHFQRLERMAAAQMARHPGRAAYGYGETQPDEFATIGEDYEAIIAPEYERAKRRAGEIAAEERRLAAQEMKARGFYGGGPWAHYMGELGRRQAMRLEDIERERRSEIARMRMQERLAARGGGTSRDLFEKRRKYAPKQLAFDEWANQMRALIQQALGGAPVPAEREGQAPIFGRRKDGLWGRLSTGEEMQFGW